MGLLNIPLEIFLGLNGAIVCMNGEIKYLKLQNREKWAGIYRLTMWMSVIRLIGAIGLIIFLACIGCAVVFILKAGEEI